MLDRTPEVGGLALPLLLEVPSFFEVVQMLSRLLGGEVARDDLLQDGPVDGAGPALDFSLGQG